jgi:hypothetical protein
VQARFSDSPYTVTNTFRRAILDAGGDEVLSSVALETAGGDPEWIELWARTAPANLLDHEMPRLLPAAVGTDSRTALFAIWEKRGNKDSVADFARNHPELGLAPE